MKMSRGTTRIRRLVADCEATMTDAFDVLQTRVEAIVQSVATAHRDTFEADALSKVAHHSRVLISTEASSSQSRASLAHLWPVHSFAASMATGFTAPGFVSASSSFAAASLRNRAHNPAQLNDKELMKLLWDLGDAVLDFNLGNQDRKTMVKLVVWARIAAHLRPQTKVAKRGGRLTLVMATKKDFMTLAIKLKNITGVEPQSFRNAMKGLIVILVTDCTKA